MKPGPFTVQQGTNRTQPWEVVSPDGKVVHRDADKGRAEEVARQATLLRPPKEHVLLVDGYHVAERLLEGVMFEVTIIETGTDLTIEKVEAPTKPERVANYLKGVNTDHFLPLIQTHVQGVIDHLNEAAQREKKTIIAYLDEWQAEYPKESRIELLNEI